MQLFITDDNLAFPVNIFQKKLSLKLGRNIRGYEMGKNLEKKI